eukprot:scaffold439469_cov48-Prasinocladus_malaysianus.AAC.1
MRPGVSPKTAPWTALRPGRRIMLGRHTSASSGGRLAAWHGASGTKGAGRFITITISSTCGDDLRVLAITSQ